jgi:hypothetical protein
MNASTTVVHPEMPDAMGPLPGSIQVPDIPGYKVMPAATLMPTRPNRGPKTGPLATGGFLIGSYQPHPPGTLPAVFALPVRDHAMQPLLEPGELAVFATDRVPEAGDCVLIGTTFGPEIRRYEPISETEWAGRAMHSEFEDIISADEPAWVIAVLVDLKGIEQVIDRADEAEQSRPSGAAGVPKPSAMNC